MNNQNSFIILGDGLLGNELKKQTNWNFISRKVHNLNINDTSSYFPALKNYDTIINCIGYTKTYSDEKEQHWNVNYKFVAELTDFCSINNKKLVHISTDHIYANSKTDASEEDVPVHLNTWYGYTKLLADGYIQLKLNNYLLIRTSHKPNPFPYKYAWIDQITNGDFVDVIASKIIYLIKKEVKGVYNVGTELKNWYIHTKDIYNTIPIRKPTNAPLDITMNLSKFKSI